MSVNHVCSSHCLSAPTGGGTAAGEGQKAQDGASVRRAAGAEGGGRGARGEPG